MKFGSLFSGIGGFDLGFEQAGMECAWQVEIDKDCQRVLAKRFPNTERFEDVTTAGNLPTVDVICGGFPCQDLSVAGKRAGLAGERSGLWFEFLRIIKSNLPRWIVIENVPGLLSGCGCAVCGQVARNLRSHSIWRSRYFDRTGDRYNAPCVACDAGRRLLASHSGRNFQILMSGLVELGYCVASRILDAQYDGVAQRRRRVFIVGSLGDGSCAEILFESESVSWNPPTRREAGAGVTPILEAGARTNGDGSRDGDGIGVEGDPMFTLQRGKQHAVAATLDQRGRGPTDAVMMNLQVSGAVSSKWAKGTGGPAGDEAYNLVTHALSSEGADASEDGTGRGTPLVVFDERNITSKENRSNPQPGDPCHTLHAAPPTLVAFSSKDHGADAGEISPTLRAQNFKDSHMNGGGQVAIAFQGNESFASGGNSDIAPTLRIGSNGAGQPPAIAFTERTRSEGRTLEAQEELAYAVTNPGSGGRTHSRQIAGGFGVRRLTPRECERLQGFPDDWTLYDASGKEISDSARYRMLGNAVCVNVAHWIGKRLLEQITA